MNNREVNDCDDDEGLMAYLPTFLSTQSGAQDFDGTAKAKGGDDKNLKAKLEVGR